MSNDNLVMYTGYLYQVDVQRYEVIEVHRYTLLKKIKGTLK
jgi:hypothetical protein